MVGRWIMVITYLYIYMCHMGYMAVITHLLTFYMIILVLVVGGRDYTTPAKGKDYTWYISGIKCQLGDYILSTTLYKNMTNPLKLPT